MIDPNDANCIDKFDPTMLDFNDFEYCNVCKDETSTYESNDMDDMMRVMLSRWPNAELDEDNDGQLVIYTGMRQDGVNVVPMDDGVNTGS